MIPVYRNRSSSSHTDKVVGRVGDVIGGSALSVDMESVLSTPAVRRVSMYRDLGFEDRGGE